MDVATTPFADKADHAAFVFNVFGDLEEPGAHIQTHVFMDEDRDYREASFPAAETQLAALGIAHQWREEDGNLQFAFDRMLRNLVDGPVMRR